MVMIAARNTNPPKAPKAMMAPIFSLAPKASLLSPSIERGTFTLGASPCCTLAVPEISLSCGWPATMMCGTGVDVAAGVSVVVVEVVVVVLLMVDFLVESRTISASAIIVVGTGRVGRERTLVGVLMVDGMLMTGGDVIGISARDITTITTLNSEFNMNININAHKDNSTWFLRILNMFVFVGEVYVYRPVNLGLK